MILAVAVVILIEVSIAGYFVYTIVPYNRADAEWERKYGKQSKEESHNDTTNSERNRSNQ